MIRRLGLPAALAMVVTQVIGVGIFLSPATMMRTLGSPWAAIAVWAVMGTLTMAGALCYAELATRFPRAGGAYVFLREAFGARTAFVYGWMALLVVDPGITAALGIGLSQYLLAATGASSALLVPLGIAVVVAFGALTLAGIETSAAILRWTALAKLAIVGVLLVAAALGTGIAGPVPTIETVTIGFGGIAASTMAAFFAFGGWWDLGRMSGEVRSPTTTLPRALVGGVAIVTAVYALLTVAFMLAAPTAAGSDDALVAAVGAALFGDAAGRLLAAMVVVAVAGSLAAVLLGAPRVYLAMARDGLFPPRIVRFDARRGTAAGATILQVSIGSVLVLLGTFDQILGYFVPGAVFFLGLSAAAVLVLPRPDAHADVFRMPLHPLPIAVFLLLITGVLVLFAVGQPLQTLFGALVIGAGLPASYLVLRREPGQPAAG